jgi:carbonic anhydrase
LCYLCADKVPAVETTLERRRFLKIAGGTALTIATAGASFAAPPQAPPKPANVRPQAPPKPDNVLSPNAALDRLMKGNARYVAGVSRQHDFKHEREALTRGQNPFAGILSCADSRIAPEYAFDAGRGDLFVCRVAGNVTNDEVIASLEYTVAVLNTPLLMVLGHKSCGAIDAAIKSIRDDTPLPGHLPLLVDALTPAVQAVLNKGGNILDAAIKQNVVLTVDKLKTATPILDKAVNEKKIRVVGAIYDLANGRVELVG